MKKNLKKTEPGIDKKNDKRPKKSLKNKESSKSPELKIFVKSLLPTAASPSASQDQLFIRSWLLGRSENTKRAYQRIAQLFLDWVSPTPFGDLSLAQVQGFIETLDASGRAKRAMGVSALKSLYSFAHRSGYVKANFGAFLKGVPVHHKLSERYLTEAEVQAMMKACKTPIESALMQILYRTGVRVSEAVGIRWQNIKKRPDGSGQIQIIGKGDKLRIIHASAGVIHGLFAIKEKSQKSWDFVFVSPESQGAKLTDRTVRNIIARLAARAGILKKVSPHWLRHAHASHALDRGAPLHLVQSTLGHASIATTGRYLHARPSESSGKYLPEDEIDDLSVGRAES